MKSEHQLRVERFMRLAKQDVPEKPTEPSLEVRVLRAKLILEEALETIQKGLGVDIEFDCIPVDSIEEFDFFDSSTCDFNIEETIDGCCDLMVVTTGTLSACGVPDEPFLEAVDQNNLDKFGPGHSFREDGKLIKPPGHCPPDIHGILFGVVDPTA